MDIATLLDVAKKTPPTEAQITELHNKLQQERSNEQRTEVVTKEFLERTYKI